MSQTAIKNKLAVQAGNDVKENIFITMVTNDLDKISDFDGALKFTADALKAASRRYERQILKTLVWDTLFKLSLIALVAIFLIISIGQLSTKPISVSPFLLVSLCLLMVSIAPLRNAARMEACIKREIDAHSEVLSMLYKEKILAKIKGLR
ncbi:MAG: hypothetical protein KKI15_02790 [Proteobacteria bacterium]|nr:hypothetical protein [Pseudomonadota bacterium]